VVRQAFLRAGAVVAAASWMGCDGGGNIIGPLPVTANVSLAPAEYTLLSGSAVGGAVRFPAAVGASAQYLVVAQFATGTPDVSANVRIQVANATTPPSASVTAPFPRAAGAGVAAADRFHTLLRRREAEFARAAPFAPRAAAAPRAQQPPPAVGHQRTFKVCANLDCNSLANVPATARYVGTRAAIYVDDSLTAGFSPGRLNSLGAQFDTTLHAIAVNAFGAESDIDSNGVVVVLLTKKVNNLVPRPECETSFVTGFFYGADLAPGQAAQHNNGEVFYGFAPDPGGPATCAYGDSTVSRILPVTFIHEFQHMISFNQHVLRNGGGTEILWLNEGLSHFAEDLAGLHYDSLGIDSTAARFLIGNFYNAFIYLRSPREHVMVTDDSPGGLESRGAEWLFVRWLADRYGMNAIRSLINTSRTGAANVAAVTTETFNTLLGRWALAVYASDLPGFTAPPALTYSAFDLRTVYGSLYNPNGTFNVPFPLVPASGTPAAGITVTGTMTSGSGAYIIVNQAAGAPEFDVTFRASNGGNLPGSAIGQMAILRIQ
jgi:hypothetical protein